MVIVEGPDGAGKSTLVREICQHHGLQVGKRGAKNRDELYKSTREDTYRALSGSVQGIEPTYVWDRLFWSEFVYANLVGRECQFGQSDLDVVPHIIKTLRVPVIFCLPELRVVRANVASAPQMDGVRSNIDSIYHNYVSMFLDEDYVPPGTNLVTYNYTLDTGSRLEEICDRVGEYINFKKERMP